MPNALQRKMFKRPRALFRLNRGFSLIELSVVLLVITLVLGAIWAAAGSVSDEAKLGQGVAQVWEISGKIRDLYTGQNLSVAQNTEAIVCAGVFPKETLLGTGAYSCGAHPPLNPWRGAIEATVNTNGTFTITFRGLEPRLCAELIARIPATRRAEATPMQAGAPVNVHYLNGAGTVMGTDLAGMSVTQVFNNVREGAGNCTGVRFLYSL